MKVAEAYSIICMIFASNFADAITDEALKKLKPNWLLKTQNPENTKGNELLIKALSSCNSSDIATDLDSFKGACSLKFFKQISDEDIDNFYKQINFNKPFTTLVNPVSNMNSRVLSILNITGLEDRIIYDNGTGEMPKTLSVDFTEANKNIECWRTKSLSFIRKSLDV